MSKAARVPFDDLAVNDDQSTLWDNDPFTGVAYELDASGQLVCESEFVEGLQEGTSRTWFAPEQLRSESEYAHGSRHGRSKEWHRNGQLASDARYLYSIKVEEMTWNERGELMKTWSLPKDDKAHELIELLAARFRGKDSDE